MYICIYIYIYTSPFRAPLRGTGETLSPGESSRGDSDRAEPVPAT